MYTSGIYAIRHDATGRLYVGSSNRIEKRWKEHQTALNRGRHHCHALQKAWIEHGEAAFTFIVVEVVNDTRVARGVQELFHIQQTDAPFNTATKTLTGPRDGFKHTPEAIEAMRRRFLGRRLLPETKAKISAWRTGRKFPAHAEAMRGRKLSAETREKMRIAHLGIIRTKEWRANSSAALKGRIFTPEHCASISAAKRGKSWSRRYGDKHDFFELIESGGDRR